MRKTIQKILEENKKIAEILLSQVAEIERIAGMICKCLRTGGKLLFIGNGGSAADSMHLAGEYVARFRAERQSLPALALSDNISIITSIGNDISYDHIFVRQIESQGKPRDLVVALSTSGESKNIIAAIRYAKKHNIKTIAFTGEKKNSLSRLANYSFHAPSGDTARIQETYLLANHIICEIVDSKFS